MPRIWHLSTKKPDVALAIGFVTPSALVTEPCGPWSSQVYHRKVRMP
jgi:hypothetical protein